MRAVVFVFLAVYGVCCHAVDWEKASMVLDASIKNGAFPGCVALIADRSGILYHEAKGHFTYGTPPPLNGDQNPKMELSTLFDMASCTKVTMTTTAIAQFYQRGEISLDTKVSDILGEEFSRNGKQNITLLNCLLHNAGFAADPVPFYNTKQFGCEETKKTHPNESFSCMDKIYDNFLSEKLVREVGSAYEYSDLSFITLMFVVGKLAQEHHYVRRSTLLDRCARAPLSSPVSLQCYFEAYVREHVISAADMTSSGFLPHGSVMKKCAPTVNDTEYLHSTYQGQVQDGNTFAMGGISGHAGLFSTAHDVFKLASKIMFAQERDSFMNKTTASYFTREYNHTQSSRAIGWNTNDHSVVDQGTSEVCGSLSPKTWMHTGYTGTMICGDPERELIVILLTNRVYPDPLNTKIMEARKSFTTAVQQIYDEQVARVVQ